jgi:hypothetical protein
MVVWSLVEVQVELHLMVHGPNGGKFKIVLGVGGEGNRRHFDVFDRRGLELMRGDGLASLLLLLPELFPAVFNRLGVGLVETVSEQLHGRDGWFVGPHA